MAAELLVLAAAVLALVVVVLLSPRLRAICWDSFVHPFNECTWECRGKIVRELKSAKVADPGSRQ